MWEELNKLGFGRRLLWIYGRIVALDMGVSVYCLEYTISGCLLLEGSRGTFRGNRMSLGGVIHV